MSRKEFEITHKDYIEYREKYLARQAVKTALKRGVLKKAEACELCDAVGNIEAHHIDYSKPLLVFWLCDSCHGQAHRKGHALNPANHEREPCRAEWGPHSSAYVASSISCEHFIHLKRIAVENNTTVSALIRAAIIEKYPVKSKQIDFLSDEYERQKNKRKNPLSRVSGLVEDENHLLQFKSGILQELWRSRYPCLPGMEKYF
jgi:hypothetical protein